MTILPNPGDSPEKDFNVLDQFQGFLNTPDISPERFSCDFETFEFPEIEISEELINNLKKINHPRNSVLGKKMESFFEVAINHSKRYDLIASNIQIIDQKRTLGELDFLIYDNENLKTLHVELVYKLYVYDPEFPTEIKRWIGPNRRDSFLEKLEKLKNRQFPLLFEPPTAKYLEQLGIEINTVQQQLCFKAQLYAPHDSHVENSRRFDLSGIYGTYYRFKDFVSMRWNDNLFYRPKKSNWSCDPAKNLIWYSYKDLVDKIQMILEEKRSALVWMKTGDKYQRFFIVWW